MSFKFLHVVRLLEALEELHLDSRNSAKAIQRKCRIEIKRWVELHRPDIANDAVTLTAVLSCCLPHRRPDRVYNLKEDKLIAAIIKCMGLGERRRFLENWKDPGTVGGFGGAVQNVVRKTEMVRGGVVSLIEVDELLDKLAGICQFSSEKLQDKVRGKAYDYTGLLKSIWNNLHSTEAKWLVRIILKSHKSVIIPENYLLETIHFLLPKVLASQSELTFACARVCDHAFLSQFPSNPASHEIPNLNEIFAESFTPEWGVRVGRPEFLQAKSLDHIRKVANGRKMAMERKYDGEFAEIHIDLSRGPRDCFKIFSKNGRDSTLDRRDIHSNLRLGLKIENEKKRGFAEKCILLGELLVYNTRTHEIKPFDHLRRHIARAGRFIGNANDDPRDAQSQLMIVLFDIVLFDYESLVRKPYSERREYLRKVVVNPRVGDCEIIESTTIDFSETIAYRKTGELFAQGANMHWEGFVMKPCDSPYIDLTRNKVDVTSGALGHTGGPSAWIKLKKDYIYGLGDSADFCIIGGRANTARSCKLRLAAETLNTFFCAVLLNKRDVKEFGALPKLKVLFNVEYSIKRSDLHWIQRHAYLDAIPYEDGIDLPQYQLSFATENRDLGRPTHVFQTPLVFEVFGGGYAKETDCNFYIPRHCRISKVHWDRNFEDSISYDELQALAEENVQGGNDDDSQQERRWIQKLMRADQGSQLEETQRSTESEETPCKRVRRSITEPPSVSSSMSASSSVPYPPSPPKLTRHQTYPSVPSTAILPPNVECSSPPRKRKYEDSPLRGADIFVMPSLIKFPRIIEKLTDHDVERILPLNVPDMNEVGCSTKRIVLVEPRKQKATRQFLSLITQGSGRGEWEVYDWRVCEREFCDWSRWKVFDI